MAHITYDATAQTMTVNVKTEGRCTIGKMFADKTLNRDIAKTTEETQATALEKRTTSQRQIPAPAPDITESAYN